MGGGKRPPPCRGEGPVLSCPIDRRLRRCACAGTQHFFVVVRRHACVRSCAGGAATGGGARQAGAVLARHSSACVRVLWPWRCGGGFAATLAVRSALAQRGSSAAAVCARAGRRGALLFSCKRGMVLRREQRARAPPVPVLEMSLMSPQAFVAVAAAVSPVCVMRAYGAAGAPRAVAMSQVQPSRQHHVDRRRRLLLTARVSQSRPRA